MVVGGGGGGDDDGDDNTFSTLRSFALVLQHHRE